MNVGDKVTVNHPKYAGITYTIIKKNPVNWVLRPANANGITRNLRCPSSLVQPVTNEDNGQASTSSPWISTPQLREGQLVTVKGAGPKWTYAPDQLFVVLRQTSVQRVKVVRLGGASVTWTVPRSMVTLVDVDSLLIVPKLSEVKS